MTEERILDVGRGWFSDRDDLLDTAQLAASRPQSRIRVLTEKGDEFRGRALMAVDEGHGKSSVILRVSPTKNRRFTLSGETKLGEVRAIGINFRHAGN